MLPWQKNCPFCTASGTTDQMCLCVSVFVSLCVCLSHLVPNTNLKMRVTACSDNDRIGVVFLLLCVVKHFSVSVLHPADHKD